MRQNKGFILLACAVCSIFMAAYLSGIARENNSDVSTQFHKNEKEPNVIFILTDNQPASIIGAYGNTDVKTPNIDAFAKEGIQFKHAYAVNGMCSPTRATLMTGLMPSQHGIHSWLKDSMLKDWPRDWSAVEEFRTLPLTLKNRGYQTAMIGKWHLGQPWQSSLGFEHWITFTHGHTLDFWENEIVANGVVKELKGQHIVDYFTDEAVDYINDYKGDKPFYLQLNYDGPYLNPPTNMGPARNRFYKEYEGNDFPSFPREALSKNLVDQISNPEFDNPFLEARIKETFSMHNDPATMANVASQNAVVDDGVGKVLAALNEKGLEENTIVIFSTDQGNFYGQHGLWQHTIIATPSVLYETAMNVPLIIRHPGKIPAGQTSETLIGQYDIPVTILDYLGVKNVSFDNSPGKSFAAHLEGKSYQQREAVFFEQEETRGIRTQNYAYWKRLKGTGQPELYNMQKDAGQKTNIYGLEGYEDIVAELDGKLDKFFDTYTDPKFDVWQGGTAKGSVGRPEMYHRLYGDEWQTNIEPVKTFSE